MHTMPTRPSLNAKNVWYGKTYLIGKENIQFMQKTADYLKFKNTSQIFIAHILTKTEQRKK